MGFYDSYEYRIKPEPVPDRVSHIVLSVGRPWDAPVQTRWYKNLQLGLNAHEVQIRLTIKTDENGVETRHVELV